MSENKLQSLSEIFNERFFRIPDFQRGYSWSKDQLEDFWEDLELLREGSSHYTGVLSIQAVDRELVKNRDIWRDDIPLFDGGYKAFYLIDGQQRLTTSIILINEILRRVTGDEFVLKGLREWRNKFLYRTHGDTNKSYIFGYEKDNPSYEFFKTKVLNQISSASANEPDITFYTKNLEYAKKFFESKIAKMDQRELETLFKKVVFNFKFNLYEIDNELDVSVTFETMNNRGKPLSSLELLKNRLIYLATLLEDAHEGEALRRDVNNVWKTLYEYLGKDIKASQDDDSFLKDHWIMFFGFEKNIADAYSRFLFKTHFTSKKLVNGTLTGRDIKEYIDSLQKSIKLWVYIKNARFSPFQENTKEWLNKLERLGTNFFTPLLMAVMNRYDEDQFLPLVKKIERFIFLCFKMSQRRADTMNNSIYRLANDVFLEEKSIEDVMSILTESEEKFIDLSNFKNYIDDKYNNDEGFYAWNGLNYFLYEYELHLQQQARGESKVKWVDVKNETIEHIFPQNPTDASWKKDVADAVNGKKKRVYRLLHSLGNLLLLSQSKNTTLSNKEFLVKVRSMDKNGAEIGYFNGSYSEIEISNKDRWTAKDIEERGIKMLKFIEDRWNINLEEHGFNINDVLGLYVLDDEAEKALEE